PSTSGQRAVATSADLTSAPGDCLFYVRSSLCSSAEARSLCERLESEAQLEPLASQVLPALPSYTGLPYDRSEVEVALFRVSVVRPGVAGGAPCTPAFAERLHERVGALRESDGCRLARLDTNRFRMTIGLTRS